MTFKQIFYLKIFLIYFFTLSFIGILGWILILAIQNLNKEYKNNQFIILNGRSRLAYYSQLKKDYEAASWPVEKLDWLLIDKKNPLSFIVQSENLAKKFNLAYEIKFFEEGTDQKSSYLSFQFIISGNFIDFMRFLDSFENAPFFLTIEKIQIIKGFSKEEKVEANFLTKVYAK